MIEVLFTGGQLSLGSLYGVHLVERISCENYALRQ